MSEYVEWPKGWAVSLLSPQERRMTRSWRVVSPIERMEYAATEARDLAAWLLWAADRIVEEAGGHPMSEPTVDLARRMPHPWCRDVSRDEAIRAAEDAAAAERTPLPDHRDLPAAVAELRERVAALEAAEATVGSGDVFRDVGCGSTGDEIDRLTAERNAAREECERLRERVAELESAPAANAGGVSSPEPISGDGKSRGSGNEEPVLYGVLWEGRPRVESWDVRDTEEQAVSLAGTDGTVVHLYAANAGGEQPQPPRGWLTRHERWRLGEMVAWLQGRAAEHPDTIHGGLCESYAADIDTLLARSTPPRVKLPRYLHAHPQYGQVLREVSVAIREAGGEVVK